MTDPTTPQPLETSREIADAVMKLSMCSLLRQEEPTRVIMMDTAERFGPEGLFILFWGMAGLILTSQGQDPHPDRTYEFTRLHEISADGITSTDPADATGEAQAVVSAIRFLTAVGNNDQITADVLFRQYLREDDPGIMMTLILLSGHALEAIIREAMGPEKTDELLALCREDLDALFSLAPSEWMRFGGSGA